MRIWNTFLFIICILLSQGCASIDWNDPASIAKEIKVEKDQFTKKTSIVGPDSASLTPNHYGTWDSVKLSAAKSETGSLVYRINVVASRTFSESWMFLDSGYDSSGAKLNVSVIDRMVISPSVLEYLLIPVSRDYLVINQDSGITFELTGSRGSKRFSIPGAYIKVFLSVAK